MAIEIKGETLIGVFTTDTELVIQVWDETMKTITGVDSAEAVGRPLLDVIPEIGSRGLLARFELVRDNGTAEILAPALHKYLIRRPPLAPSAHFTEMRQLVKISALQDDGKIRGLMVLVEDVTRRMEQEREQTARLKDPDETVRLEAAKAIAVRPETLSAEDAEPLINALGDNNWRVRRQLVEGLSRRSAPDAVAALLTAFRKDHLDFGTLNGALQVLQANSIDTADTLVDFLSSDDADLRMQALLALGEQNNPNSIPAMLAALEDSDTNVRYHAIEALGKMGAVEAIEPLMNVAETRDFFLSFAALEALKQIADTSIAKRVLPLLNDDELREAAVEALGSVGDAETPAALVSLLNESKLSPDVAAVALCALRDRYENGSSGAGDMIAGRVRRSIQPDGISTLLTGLDRTRDPSIREIIRVCGWIDSPEIRERLAVLIEDDELRGEAVKALIDQGDPAADVFIGKLESEDAEVRKAAARALGGFGGERVVAVLAAELEAESEAAAAAAVSLGEIGGPEAFEALVGRLGTDSKILHRAAVSALASISRPHNSPQLCNLLDNEDPKVRASAISIIGHLATKEGTDAVLKCCSDPDAEVRIAALEQLSNVAPENAVPVLVRAIKDSVPRVRSAAAQALGKFENEDASDALRTALTDTDPWTRYFAVRSLAALNDADSQEIFKEMSENDEAEQVRAAAAEALTRP